MKRYIQSVLSSYCSQESKRKKEVEEDVMVSVELSSSSAVYKQQRDSVVSVVLAGGIVELYPGPVSASAIMEKHPGLCLARPEVFSQPHRAEVSPRERLFPGNKFYLVPQSTVKKLRQKASNQFRNEGKSGKLDEVAVTAEVGWKERGGESMEEPGSMAKDFYVSREKWTKRFEQQRKPIRRPICRGRMYQGLLLGWKPSLQTITENWSP